MLTKVEIFDPRGLSSIVVNELGPTVYYPVEKFNWTPDMIGDDLPRLASFGRNGNYKDVEVLNLEMEGHIKTDTTTDYWVRRKNLLNIVIPDPNQIYPYHGSIQVTLDGDANVYTMPVNLTHYDVPMEANYPTVTPFRFEWDGLTGYWLVNVGTPWFGVNANWFVYPTAKI